MTMVPAEKGLHCTYGIVFQTTLVHAVFNDKRVQLNKEPPIDQTNVSFSAVHAF